MILPEKSRKITTFFRYMQIYFAYLLNFEYFCNRKSSGCALSGCAPTGRG